MKICHSIQEAKQAISVYRKEEKSIGFVPTMGALHEGHLELVRQAGRENDHVVVSIFVNPIQFNNPEDLQNYPRTLDKDLEKLSHTPCSLVFVPTAGEMYPEPDNTEFDFGSLDKVMEGVFRPGHFRGVAVVVIKLFEITTPDKAYFGEKDFQQLAIIQHVVRNLSLGINIIPCPTVREADGLAMSSRNARLLPEERLIAPEIYKVLDHARNIYSWFTPRGLEKMIIGELEQEPRFRVEYAQAVDTVTLKPLNEWENSEHAVVCVAVYLGQVRLIDNIRLY